MTLKQQIQENMKSAMRAREVDRLGTIRLLIAAIRQREIDERIDLDDLGVIAVVDKMIKQRRDSIAQFELASREDLAAKERAEVATLSSYLPQALSPAEVNAQIEAAFQSLQSDGAAALGMADMGRIMAILKPKLAGRADLGKVSGLVKARLG